MLLTIAVGNAIGVFADFTAMRGLLSGAAPGGWVEWPAWVYNQTGGVGAFLLICLIFFFPNGRLPGPRWRWIAWGAAAAVVVLVAGAMIAPGTTQLSPRLSNVQNPIGVAALGGLTNGPIFGIGPLLLLVLVLYAVVIRFRHSRDGERSQLRWFAYVAAGSLAVIVAGYGVGAVDGPLGNEVTARRLVLGSASLFRSRSA